MRKHFSLLKDPATLLFALASVRGIYTASNLYLFVILAMLLLPLFLKSLYASQFHALAPNVHPRVLYDFRIDWFDPDRYNSQPIFYFSDSLFFTLLILLGSGTLGYLLYRLFRCAVNPRPSFPEDLFALPVTRKVIVFALEDWPVVKILFVLTVCLVMVFAPFGSVRMRELAGEYITGGKEFSFFDLALRLATFPALLFSVHRLSQVLAYLRSDDFRFFVKRRVPSGILTSAILFALAALLQYSDAPSFAPNLGLLAGLYVFVRNTVPVPEERCWPPSLS